MSVAAVRAGLVAKLQTIDPVSGRSYGYAPDSLTPPTAFVGSMLHDPRPAFDEANIIAQVWVAVSRAASTNRAVNTLDEYADGGDYDVTAALESTPTAWDSLAVTGSEWPVQITVGAGDFAAIRFDCEVFL